MTTYVLVHGLGHGSWCWSRVRERLIARGHIVLTPTLTGLGERSHLLSRDVNLETHILDVANLLTWENLNEIVLVGHSYAGTVVRHVADRMPQRIRSLVYLDAFVLENGVSVCDVAPHHRKRAEDHGDGWKCPPIPAAVLAVNAADADWVDQQCTMHPLATLEAKTNLTGACNEIADIGYIRATGFNGPFKQFYDTAEQYGWWREEFPCGHDIMLDMPNELSALLLKLA
jgi:pimeloyl-ACP methyl ester carboxylesterase